MMLKQKGLGRAYQDGDIIIRQGTVGDCLYVIQEGTVEVIHERQDRQVKITELGKSDFFLFCAPHRRPKKGQLIINELCFQNL